ncbi:MAG: SUMF1/EgtB/PvdO family nonheme iron enzyme [Acidobacteriota bacterium]
MVRFRAAVFAAAIALTLVLQAAEPGMAFIPACTFQQGRSIRLPDTEVKWYPTAHKDDQPAHAVTLDAFYLDISEVTNEAYAAFAKVKHHRTPYHWLKGQVPEGKARQPVANVSWDDATAYCAWKGKRLPTEAEWERAARGNAEGAMYPWGDRNITSADARYGSETPAPVCGKAKNYFGLCDMIGNVWEWNADWYERTYYANAPAHNPTGPETGLYRVLRGGSWFDTPGLFLMVSYRSWARAAERSPTIGFRCAKSFSPRHPSAPN